MGRVEEEGKGGGGRGVGEGAPSKDEFISSETK